jgi:hypothetical protein
MIPFGASGYVLRYRLQGDTIFIIAIKHGKEAGFSSPTEFENKNSTGADQLSPAMLNPSSARRARRAA